MKSKRQDTILSLIENYEICTQDELLSKLCEADFSTTQATVSRDIKELGLIKISTDGNDGKYKYAPRPIDPIKKNAVKFKAVFMEAVIDVDYAINTVVLKCHIGMGNAACAALDTMNIADVVGTIAGDDTIFILLRTENAAKEFVDKIKQILSAKDE